MTLRYKEKEREEKPKEKDLTMRFKVTVNSVCPGGDHLNVTFQQVAGSGGSSSLMPVGVLSAPTGLSRAVTISKSEVPLEPEEFEIAARRRVISHMKEAGLTFGSTLLQIRTAIEGREFQI